MLPDVAVKEVTKICDSVLNTDPEPTVRLRHRSELYNEAFGCMLRNGLEKGQNSILDTGPPYNRVKFFELMNNPVMKDNIVVAGGKAAWQLADEAIIEKLNIDHVLLGEGELSGPEMFKSILEGEKLPRILKGKVPYTEEIPNILGATIHGLPWRR